MNVRISGSSRRRANRDQVFGSLTRADKFRYIRALDSVVDANNIAEASDGRVKRQALRQVMHLEGRFDRAPETVRSADSVRDLLPDDSSAVMTAPNETEEFRQLVERFRKEGKTNPERSARASIAAKVGNAKRKAPAEATV